MTHTRQSRTRSARTLRLAMAFTLSLLTVWTMLPDSLRGHFMPTASAAGLTFTVSNNNNSGAGSLRQAILDANAASGTDTIKFAVGSGSIFIQPSSPLPTITSPVVIDGTTQPGYTGVPLIQLDGALAGAGANGLHISAGDSTVKGLAINRFNGNGIRMDTNGGNKVKGCIIGNITYATTGGNGILIFFTSLNTIGGTSLADRNVISGNGGSGVLISGGAANSVIGNYIGTDLQGNGDFGNGHSGVLIGSKSNSNNIGSVAPGGGNLISGNNQTGILLEEAGVGNVILGNKIGTNGLGDKALPNGRGVYLIQSPNNSIGNGKPEGRNIISGNGGAGIIADNSSGSIVKGNYIGTDVSGQAKLANGGSGIVIRDGSANCTIGGAGGEGNIVAGNGEYGIEINNSPAPGNKIQGNLIGVNFANNALGNSNSGIFIAKSSGNVIGDDVNIPENAPLANIIAHNGGAGVYLTITGNGNSIYTNSIYSNAGLGIDLNDNGPQDVTPNDTGDGDTGPNNLQNYPVIYSAINAPDATKISYSLSAKPNTEYLIGFYGNQAGGCDPTGYGEGQATIKYITVTTDASGNYSNPVFTTPLLPPNTAITALATEKASGNTSEFSQCKIVTVEQVQPTTLQLSGANPQVIESAGMTGMTLTRTGDTTTAVSVKYTTSDGTAKAGADYVATSGTVDFAPGETAKIAIFPITDDSTDEPDETLNITLSDPSSGATLGSYSTTIFTILDDDAAPSLSINDASVTEGNDGTANATFTVSLSSASAQTVTVMYATANGSADSIKDYQASNATMTFNPGEMAKTFDVPVKGDVEVETDETFFVNLSNPTNATLMDNQGIGTIVNNDDAAPAQPSVQFTSLNYTVAEDAGRLDAQITRTGDASTAFTVSFKTEDGNALQKSDFSIALGVLKFAAGETSKTVSIFITDDVYVEGGETFTLVLNNPVGATLGANTSSVVMIADNDVSTSPNNPLEAAPFFVRQHYIDFLNREPDADGFQGWQDILNNCPQGATNCDRIEVSSAFFRSPEFYDRGYFVYRFYETALGRKPEYLEFMADLRRVTGFLTDQQLEAEKVDFVKDFMASQEYKQRYDQIADPAAFVDALAVTAGVTLSNRDQLIESLQMNQMERDQVLRAVAESTQVKVRFYNKAFVVMQYFGYLRRDPDALYLNWIETLNQTNDYRTMVNGFINSPEYRQRFGQ